MNIKRLTEVEVYDLFQNEMKLKINIINILFKYSSSRTDIKDSLGLIIEQKNYVKITHDIAEVVQTLQEEVKCQSYEQYIGSKYFKPETNSGTGG